MSSDPLNFQGLDLSDLDSVTEAEREAFRAHYRATKGAPLPGLEFWLDHRPDVLKRQRVQQLKRESPERRRHQLATALCNLHYYVILGFYEEGILYQIKWARSLGAGRAQVIATIAVAYLHGSVLGMNYVAKAAGEYLDDYVEPAPRDDLWPAGWGSDPDALRSGLDFDDPEMRPGELELLRDWYLRVPGEVPPYVDFLGRHNPDVLKAYRHRYEHALGDALPKEMMPVLLAYWETIRANHAGIRENVLLGRGLGMTKGQMLDALVNAFNRAGPGAYTAVLEAAGDVFDSWEPTKGDG